jgi:hypothetical protein
MGPLEGAPSTAKAKVNAVLNAAFGSDDTRD